MRPASGPNVISASSAESESEPEKAEVNMMLIKMIMSHEICIMRVAHIKKQKYLVTYNI